MQGEQEVSHSFIQVPAPLALRDSLRPNERIVCRNATVIEDDIGNISWLDNDGMVLITVEENDEQEDKPTPETGDTGRY